MVYPRLIKQRENEKEGANLCVCVYPLFCSIFFLFFFFRFFFSFFSFFRFSVFPSLLFCAWIWVRDSLTRRVNQVHVAMSDIRSTIGKKVLRMYPVHPNIHGEVEAFHRALEAGGQFRCTLNRLPRVKEPARASQSSLCFFFFHGWMDGSLLMSNVSLIVYVIGEEFQNAETSLQNVFQEGGMECSKCFLPL